jgi:hypothetical protein
VAVRVCLIDHRISLTDRNRGLLEAFQRRFDLTTIFVDDGWPRNVVEVPEYQSYEAIIWHVKFRQLLHQEPFDWQDYVGARIMYDQDTFTNYNTMGGARYLGKWPEVVRANGFHVLVSTGQAVSECYLDEGIHTCWIPKGYDATRITNEMRVDRDGICFFGAAYAARRAMLAFLDRERIPYTAFRCRPGELNDRLNRFAGCLICNQDLRGPSVLPRRIYRSNHFIRHAPPGWLRPAPGPEPMMKNFEVAGAGCAPICDEIPELADLGFRDGLTMVSYSRFDELAEKLRWYALNPETLAEVGRRAADLARSRHSWDHRVEDFEKLIASRAYVPS